MQREHLYGGAFSVVKSVLTALAISIVFAILFAAIIRALPISERTVYCVNQTVKVLSSFLGAVFFIRGAGGWKKGLLSGVLFFALSYVAFSAVGGTFALSPLCLAELAFTALGGVIGGVLGVNLRRE